MKIINGIDITNYLRDEFQNLNLIKRVLTNHEYEDYLATPDENKIKFIATYWTIKEAIFKALQGKVNFKQIDIKKENYIYYCVCNKIKFSISTSFSEPYIIANVFGIIQ